MVKEESRSRRRRRRSSSSSGSSRSSSRAKKQKQIKQINKSGLSKKEKPKNVINQESGPPFSFSSLPELDQKIKLKVKVTKFNYL